MSYCKCCREVDMTNTEGYCPNCEKLKHEGNKMTELQKLEQQVTELQATIERMKDESKVPEPIKQWEHYYESE